MSPLSPMTDEEIPVPADAATTAAPEVVDAPAAAPTIFDVQDLSVLYSGFRAVKDVRLQVAKNEITAFIGPSGCGKTTVLRCFNRMNDLVEGAVVAMVGRSGGGRRGCGRHGHAAAGLIELDRRHLHGRSRRGFLFGEEEQAGHVAELLGPLVIVREFAHVGGDLLEHHRKFDARLRHALEQRGGERAMRAHAVGGFLARRGRKGDQGVPTLGLDASEAAAERNAAVERGEILAQVLGQLEPATLTDAWWLGTTDVTAGTADRVRALGLGEPASAATTTDQLSTGPLRVGIRVALGLLVVAAVVLAVAGTVLHTVASLEARAVEVARLLGIGIARRAVVASLVVQHAAVTLLVVGAGAVAGGVAAVVVGPHLAVSETGQVPVPAPVPVVPWAVEAILVGGLLVLLTAAVLPVAQVLVRRAGAAHLRLDGTS